MTDEITEDAIRSKAKAYLKHMGWAPGQRLGLHSAIELMTSFGAACRKITDRCAYPECGCDYDAICSAAVEKIERGDEKPPSPIETEQRERVVAALTPEVREDLKAKALNAPYQTWAAFTDDSGPRPHTNLVSMNPATRCVISLPGLHKNDVVVQFFSAVQPFVVLSLLGALEEAETQFATSEAVIRDLTSDLAVLRQENERLRDIGQRLLAADAMSQEGDDVNAMLTFGSAWDDLRATLQAPHSQGGEP